MFVIHFLLQYVKQEFTVFLCFKKSDALLLFSTNWLLLLLTDKFTITEFAIIIRNLSFLVFHCKKVTCKEKFSQKFHKVHKITPMLESLFNIVAGKDSNTGVFLSNLRNTYLEEHLRTTASKHRNSFLEVFC